MEKGNNDILYNGLLKRSQNHLKELENQSLREGAEAGHNAKMEEVLNALQEVCNTLEDVRDTAALLTTRLRLQKAKKRLMTLTLEMEEDMKANQGMLKQNKNNKLKALRLMSDKFKKQVTEHVELQEELLRLAAELGRFTGD